MKKLLLGLALLSSISSTFAETNGASEAMTMQSKVTSNSASQGDSDVEAFRDILNGGKFYALLLAMTSELPEVARSGEFVMLINEMHLMNEKLTMIAESLQKSNSINIHPSESRGDAHG